MEKHIGRHLTPDEVVHHKNGDKQDNRIENLELFDTNAKHLADTLVGHCPNWSPRGLANMRATSVLRGFPHLAREYDFRQIGSWLLSIQKELGLDAPPNNREIDRYLERKQITAVEALGMAAMRERQLP
jgi:hypothetical protein